MSDPTYVTSMGEDVEKGDLVGYGEDGKMYRCGKRPIGILEATVVVKNAKNLLEILRQYPHAKVRELITERGEDAWRVTVVLMEPV